MICIFYITTGQELTAKGQYITGPFKASSGDDRHRQETVRGGTTVSHCQEAVIPVQKEVHINVKGWCFPWISAGTGRERTAQAQSGIREHYNYIYMIRLVFYISILFECDILLQYICQLSITAVIYTHIQFPLHIKMHLTGAG